ncbi:MAG: hypothetical protein HY690_03125 [Chloroflexi bacterium]|nr:hypothetical protein [Chloroflexota bacterium]
MHVIVTTSVAPTEVLRFDLGAEQDFPRLLHQNLPRDVFVIHPEVYWKLVDHLGPLEDAGIAVDDLTLGEQVEARHTFADLARRIRGGELVPGRD